MILFIILMIILFIYKLEYMITNIKESNSKIKEIYYTDGELL